jgi:hypothetical protein
MCTGKPVLGMMRRNGCRHTNQRQGTVLFKVTRETINIVHQKNAFITLCLNQKFTTEGFFWLFILSFLHPPPKKEHAYLVPRESEEASGDATVGLVLVVDAIQQTCPSISSLTHQQAPSWLLHCSVHFGSEFDS